MKSSPTSQGTKSLKRKLPKSSFQSISTMCLSCLLNHSQLHCTFIRTENTALRLRRLLRKWLGKKSDSTYRILPAIKKEQRKVRPLSVFKSNLAASRCCSKRPRWNLKRQSKAILVNSKGMLLATLFLRQVLDREMNWAQEKKKIRI